MGRPTMNIRTAYVLFMCCCFGCASDGKKNGDAGGMANTGGAVAGSTSQIGGVMTGGETMAAGNNSSPNGGANGGMTNPINDCPRTVPNDYVCNPYCNLGCQRGEHCTISNNVFSCVATGAGQLGSPCEQSSDCGHKMACFRVTGESVSTCRQFCNSDGECPGGRKCELGVNFGSGPHQFCSEIAVGCDPFLDNAPIDGGGGMSMAGGSSMAGGDVAGNMSGGDIAGHAAGGSIAGGARQPVMAMCESVEPNEFGACDQDLGWSMNSDGVCTAVSGCGCGELCGKVYPSKSACEIACFGRVEGAPFCDAIEPNEFGACEAVLGFGINGEGECEVVSGCGCGDRCTGRVYPTLEECTQICLHGQQPAMGGLNSGGMNLGGMNAGGDPAQQGGHVGGMGGGGMAQPGGQPMGGHLAGGQAMGGIQMMSFGQERMRACSEEQGCYLSRDATKCMDSGTLAKGDVCDAPNACAPGLHCLVECTEVCSTKVDHPQSCQAQCMGPSPELLMAIGREDVEKFEVVSEENELGVCLSTRIPGCDIFGDECGAGQGCYNVRGGRACLPEGTGDAGAACNSATECKSGHVCLYGACLPYCRDSEDTPAEHRCAQKCPGNTVLLAPLMWQGGACTNVMAQNTCDFWAEGADCNNDTCVPTPVGEICRPMTSMAGVGDACSDTTDCQRGLVCPRQVGQCKTACSIEPFVDGGFTPPICMDDCPNGPGMALAPESRIGYCP